MNIKTTTEKVVVRRFRFDLDEADLAELLADPPAFARKLRRQLNGRANGGG